MTAASGAVGSVVGQIAKLKGCRVVGIAGGPQKCRYVVEELGFDACVDYQAPDFAQQLAAATPGYVDVLFENVGGPVLDAVLQRIADHARIVLCGNISQYNATEPYGLKGMRQLLMHRVTVHAFVIADHRDYWPAAQAELSKWLREGKLKYREDVSEGLPNAPQAFIRMLSGQLREAAGQGVLTLRPGFGRLRVCKGFVLCRPLLFWRCRPRRRRTACPAAVARSRLPRWYPPAGPVRP